MNLLYNKVFLFWHIGKSVYEKSNSCNNIVEKYSNYCSYYFGNSIQFTRENIHLMKRFYMNFPIFHSTLGNFSWEQYELLLSISDRKERSFYYTLLNLFQSDYEETLELLNNRYYFRI